MDRGAPAASMMGMQEDDVEAQLVEMMVPLYSYGCGKKIKKALAHFKGIYSVNVDYKEQKVTVWGIFNKKDVLDTIRGKRKGARFWKPQLVGDEGVGNLQQQQEAAESNNISFCRSSPHDHKGRQRIRTFQLMLLINLRAAWKKVFK